MSLFTRRNAFLLSTTLLASSLGVSAFARDAVPAPETPDSDSREVIVTARRPVAESDEAALKVQRNSDSLVSVLSADAIGDLPDQNVAFAVGRLPGVAVERDQGQARYINLRGAPVYWTTLSFDGLSVVSPEGRASRFDNIPSAIASQIVVQKALVPSMSGDTVAGNVDIRTRRAFDYKGRKITGKLGLGHVELGDGVELDSAFVYSDTFMGGKLGLVAQGSYYKREMATENWETDPYLPARAVDLSKRFAQDTKNKHYRLTRENYSGSLRADYRFNENHSLFFSTINTVFHDDELRDQFIFNLDQGTNAAGVAYNSDAYFTGNDPKFGTSYGARVNARITYRDNYDSMTTNTLGGEHRFSNGLEASWRLNYTWTDNTADNPAEIRFRSASAFGTRPTVVYDFRNTASNIVALYATGGTTGARTQGALVRNIESFAMPLQQISSFESAEITSAYTGKVDFDYGTELFGHATKVEFGGLFTTRTKENNQYDYTLASVTGNTLTYSQLAQDGPYLGEQYLGYDFRYTNKEKVLETVAISRAGAALVFNTTNYWKVGEKISAGYLMATTSFDWGNLVYGARVEHIKNTGEAYAVLGASGTSLVSVKSDETLVYPSVHVNYNLRDNVKLRVGLTTSASRPDYDDMRPNLVIDDTNDTISGGNPTAKPEKQVGLDAYVEWYMVPEGFFSAGVFYKDIKDVLMKQTSTFGLTDFDTVTDLRSTYAFTSIQNGGKGHLQGLEVFYSGTARKLVQDMNAPEWLEGFGVKVSGTWTSSEVQTPVATGVVSRKIPLLGTSDAVYNIQAIYEKYGLTVRLAYQYRTPWGQSVDDYKLYGSTVLPAGNGDIYWDADEELDLSVRYQINKNLEWYLDGANLTNQGARRYGDNDQYPIEYEKFGKRFITGLRFNF